MGRDVFWKLLVCGALALVLSACAGTSTGESLLEGKAQSLPRTTSSECAKEQNLQKYLATAATDQAPPAYPGTLKPGNDQLVGSAPIEEIGTEDLDSRDVMLNLVGAPIAQAAKSVLGDIFEVSYSVDGRVTGTVTLQTPQPISRRKLLQLFQDALRDNGAAIIAGAGTYRVVPLTETARSTSPLQTRPGSLDRPGIRPEIISLRYVSADDMREVLDPMIPPGMIVEADSQRNILIMSGTAQEIAALRDTISIFDVDWMKGMSFALVPVRSSSPAAIVQDLEQIFETKKGPLRGVVRFVPNARLKSVLIITSRAKYLKDATRWIQKLDVLAGSNEEAVHVYHVQNRNATEIAAVLSSILKGGSAGANSINGQVAPRYAAATVGTQGDGAQTPITGGPETPQGGIDSLPGSVDDGSDGMAQGALARARVVADEANNALLVYCSDQDYERLQMVLREIDTVPNQVLLEAVIAEVSLDDDLRFGVRWFLGEHNNGGTFSDATSGVVSSVFPGFSYFLKANDISFALNALSSVTNVRVLSAPSLVVLDNKTATLQVGDQVPVVTQTAKNTTAADAPLVSTVELKDTGVILNVTPRVNDSGLVTLDIEQEVSTVVKTTTSGIDSPTIRQRRMKTSVVVNDAEALALGGLIQERETTGKTKVPVLGDVPILGAAFRQKEVATSRTELIIFIRPRVIRDMAEARQVTEEFRKELSIEAPRVRRQGDPTPGEELKRIFE